MANAIQTNQNIHSNPAYYLISRLPTPYWAVRADIDAHYTASFSQVNQYLLVVQPVFV